VTRLGSSATTTHHFNAYDVRVIRGARDVERLHFVPVGSTACQVAVDEAGSIGAQRGDASPGLPIRATLDVEAVFVDRIVSPGEGNRDLPSGLDDQIGRGGRNRRKRGCCGRRRPKTITLTSGRCTEGSGKQRTTCKLI